jgi:hypothetical protein
LESVNGPPVAGSHGAPFAGRRFQSATGGPPGKAVLSATGGSDFGNVNYKSGGPIKIVNFDKGVERLARLSQNGGWGDREAQCFGLARAKGLHYSGGGSGSVG